MTTINEILGLTGNTQERESAEKAAQNSSDILSATHDADAPRQRLEFDASSGTGEGSLNILGKNHSQEERDKFIREFLIERGYDPETVWLLNDSIRVSQWQKYDGEWLTSYRFQIQTKPEFAADISDIIDRIFLDDAPEIDDIAADKTRVIFVTDTHLGKGPLDGAGTDTLIERWESGVKAALKDIPDDCAEILVVFGGDLIEGATSQNGKNIDGFDLTLTQQQTAAMSMCIRTLKEAAKYAPRVIATVVPGNHGESTRIQNVTITDSWDIHALKSAEIAIDQLANSEGRFEFIYPQEGRGSVVIETAGGTIAAVHGHHFKGKPLPGAESWWNGHITNDRPERDASVLLCGHYHSFQMEAWTARRWIIFGSALETESAWLAHKTGATGHYGVTAFDFVAGSPQKVSIYR